MDPKAVFLVEHLRSDGGSEDIKTIGVYSSRHQSEAAVERMLNLPGFSEFPEIVDPVSDDACSGFYISEMILNHDYWGEGFVSEPSGKES